VFVFYSYKGFFVLGQSGELALKNPCRLVKMATRIPVSWLLLVCVIGVFAFFAYHIVQASSTNETQLPQQQPSQRVTFAEDVPPVPKYMTNAPSHDDDGQEYVEAAHKPHPAPKAMPKVAGQTEEDLRAPEPLQATPPTTQYDPPEATDPMNRHVHMSSEFGSNLRHPEQMIERRPPPSMDYVVPSGLGSEQSHEGGNRQVSFAPEMAQNGGEFMQGISAFDMSESGTAYSML